MKLRHGGRALSVINHLRRGLDLGVPCFDGAGQWLHGVSSIIEASAKGPRLGGQRAGDPAGDGTLDILLIGGVVVWRLI